MPERSLYVLSPIAALDEIWEIEATEQPGQEFVIRVGEFSCRAFGTLNDHELDANIDGHRQTAVVVPGTEAFSIVSDEGTAEFSIVEPDLGIEEIHDDGSGFKEPMKGTVVDIRVEVGESVRAGDTIVIMEAIKMEHAIKAPVDGTVTDVYFAVGDLVDGGSDLVGFEPSPSTD